MTVASDRDALLARIQKLEHENDRIALEKRQAQAFGEKLRFYKLIFSLVLFIFILAASGWRSC